jgi:glycosyltransferase involved in cell wall biosynthesis
MTKSNITVGFLTTTDPLDKRSWSGTQYRMFKALENEFEHVVKLGPVHLPKVIGHSLFHFRNFVRAVFGKKLNVFNNIWVSRYNARVLAKRIAQSPDKIDVLFCPASSQGFAYLKSDLPICYASDSSSSQIQLYYNRQQEISQLSVKHSHQIEIDAIKRSHVLTYPSTWAADYVAEHYKVDPKRIHMIEYGANLDQAPEREDVIHRDFDSTINLLFLGLDWERKGGSIAFEAFKMLLDRGHDVTMTVCGCVPPVKHPKMTVIPLLNKNIEEENKRFVELLHASHVLFLPTRAECYGIVFCEAAAFGLPVITTATGGVTTIVKHGESGLTLPVEDGPQAYADAFETLLADRDLLRRMSVITRDRYEQQLNWDVWGARVGVLLKQLATDHK